MLFSTVDGVCDHEGKCDEKEDLGNGVCNAECNNLLYHWDGGDCCNPNVTTVIKTCYDPNSAERYATIAIANRLIILL